MVVPNRLVAVPDIVLAGMDNDKRIGLLGADWDAERQDHGEDKERGTKGFHGNGFG